MNVSELTRLGFDTEGFVPGADYVPDPECADDGIYVDFVYRAFLQLDQLNARGGVNLLGGSRGRLDDVHLALEDGVDLETAVERFGSEGQRQRVRQLIADGQVGGS